MVGQSNFDLFAKMREPIDGDKINIFIVPLE